MGASSAHVMSANWNPPVPELFRLKVDIEGAGVVSFDKRQLRSVLRQAGTEVAQLARSLIRKGTPGGRQYATRRAGAIIGYQGSAPGQPPASRTGALASSIGVRSLRSGDAISVRAKERYALPLEAGGQHLEPRPFLSAALDAKRTSIDARLRATIVGGLQWQKIKP